MKTKLLFIFLFLIAFTKSIFSQDYIPMLNSSWNVSEANFGGTTSYIIQPGVDVVIGGATYKKFLDKTVEIYLREDIATRKVYRRINNADQMLYDFSLTNGSSITLPNGYTYTVTVNNINVVGGTRKRIHLYHFLLPNETWIEGVGSNLHPLKPYYEMPSDPHVFLSCSSINNVNVYNHGIANGQANPTDCSMLLNRYEVIDMNAKFYPNPFKTTFTISVLSNLENASLKIFNSIGQLVKENKNINGQKFIFNRDNLQSGIYFVQLSQGQKLIANTKMLIVD